jgi:uncharacterized membrane protein YoaK (UPF0700 family)
MRPFLPISLSLIAGVTDVTSWLLLGGFFSAHMTGNLVVFSADAVAATRPGVSAMLAIPTFVATTALAAVVGRRLGAGRKATTLTLLGGQAVLLLAAAGLSFTTHASAHPDQPPAVAIAMCAASAMAAQHVFLHLHRTGAPPTAVMTGNLVSATIAITDLVRSRGHDEAARRTWSSCWPLIAGFGAGCVVGAAGADTLGDRAAIVPAALAILLVVALTAGAPSEPDDSCNPRRRPTAVDAPAPL